MHNQQHTVEISREISQWKTGHHSSMRECPIILAWTSKRVLTKHLNVVAGAGFMELTSMTHSSPLAASQPAKHRTQEKNAPTPKQQITSKFRVTFYVKFDSMWGRRGLYRNRDKIVLEC